MKKFRNYQPNQLLLLPPAMSDWLPKGHLAQFVSDVVDTLDLHEIFDAYDGEKGGQPPYHPLLMVKLLTYGYMIGLRSSRQIERKTWEDVAFRVLAADQHPDHDSIANFRARHRAAFSKIFDQVLRIAFEAGLADLYHVAVDGSKINANASRYKSLTKERVEKREKKLQEHVNEILDEADKVDKEEDEKFGNRSTFQLPEELQDQEARLQRIRELKDRMEKEQKELDEAAEKERSKKKPAVGGRKKKPNAKSSKKKSLVRNLTDYDSRIMHQPGGNWAQSFNAQAVVDGKSQIIVAADVTNEGSDVKQLIPMLRLTEEKTGKKPQNASADTGYYSKGNVQAKELAGINLLVPPGRSKERKTKHGKFAFPVSDLMRDKLEDPANKELYKKRKTIVEPVFGQIKDSVQSFRRFTYRGLEAVRQEWSIVCMTHNLMKLYRSGWRPA